MFSVFVLDLVYTNNQTLIDDLSFRFSQGFWGKMRFWIDIRMLLSITPPSCLLLIFLSRSAERDAEQDRAKQREGELFSLHSFWISYWKLRHEVKQKCRRQSNDARNKEKRIKIVSLFQFIENIFQSKWNIIVAVPLTFLSHSIFCRQLFFRRSFHISESFIITDD